MEELLARACALPIMTPRALLASVLQRGHPFHRRFVTAHPGWAPAGELVDAALTALRATVTEPESIHPDATTLQDRAAALRAAMPVDRDDLMLPIPGVSATYYLMYALAEQAEPCDYRSEADWVRAGLGIVDQILREEAPGLAVHRLRTIRGGSVNWPSSRATSDGSERG